MRVTEFWERMDHAFGVGYSRSVARDQVIPKLDGHTVEQALAAGEDVKTVWRAVWSHFELPASER